MCIFENSIASMLKDNKLRSTGFSGGTSGKIHLPMQETWVQSLGREDPLEKEMATHSSTLTYEIPQTEEPGRLQSMGSQESHMT